MADKAAHWAVITELRQTAADFLRVADLMERVFLNGAPAEPCQAAATPGLMVDAALLGGTNSAIRVADVITVVPEDPKPHIFPKEFPFLGARENAANAKAVTSAPGSPAVNVKAGKPKLTKEERSAVAKKRWADRKAENAVPVVPRAPEKPFKPFNRERVFQTLPVKPLADTKLAAPMPEARLNDLVYRVATLDTFVLGALIDEVLRKEPELGRDQISKAVSRLLSAGKLRKAGSSGVNREPFVLPVVGGVIHWPTGIVNSDGFGALSPGGPAGSKTQRTSFSAAYA